MVVMAREIIHDLNGRVIRDEWWDTDRKWLTLIVDGITIEDRPMTTAEWLTYGPQPLDKMGALAALLVVQGVLPIEDAANIAGVTPDALVTEVQGWAAAGGG